MSLKVLGFAPGFGGNEANETQHGDLATTIPDRSTQPTQNQRTEVNWLTEVQDDNS
jgi:hypothetical protein